MPFRARRATPSATSSRERKLADTFPSEDLPSEDAYPPTPVGGSMSPLGAALIRVARAAPLNPSPKGKRGALTGWPTSFRGGLANFELC